MSLRILEITLLCGLSLVATKLPGATILLHDHATDHGAVVYLGDVGDISAATPSQVQDLATTPLVSAPAPGTHEFLQATQIRDLLISRGVDPSQISLTGARVVEISRRTQPVATPQPEAKQPRLSPEESRQAVTEAIQRYLLTETSHRDWEIETDLSDANLRELTTLGPELTASAGRSPWTGNQRFQISAPGAQKAVTLNVKVDRLQDTVVAVHSIQPGDLVGVADVEVRLQSVNSSGTVISSLDQVLGKEALRAIEPETVLVTGHLRSPLQVQRGETVEVFARTGGIVVKTYAVVRQDGSLGDLVQVETLDRKEKFAARVSGWKQLDVLPTGASAADFATLHSPSHTHR